MSWTIKPSDEVNKTVRVLCDRCKQKTAHRILAAVDYSGESDDGDIQAWGSAEVIQCQGCEDIGFRDTSSCSESIGFDGRCDVEERLYPPRTDHTLTGQLYLRDDIYDIPDVVQAIYRETLKAVQHEMPTLAGVGIRAILEATCQERKTKKHKLADKIDELEGMSLLTPAGAKILHGIRLLGNDAAHEMKAPTKKQITAALKVIDHLLLGVYVLPQEASILPKPKTKATKKTVAKRTGTNASGGTP